VIVSGRENSEQRILDAATHLFATRGYAATGIRHIADEVGVTSAALYYYARTKDDLLLSVIRAG
jgi:TetR/AcrR family transcriptional regulator, cholesterol catabolism regulator